MPEGHLGRACMLAETALFSEKLQIELITKENTSLIKQMVGRKILP